MSRRHLLLLAGLLSAIAAFPADAWSPATQQAVVTTAAQVLSKEGTLQLTRFDRDVRDGAAASDETLARLLPGLATGPVQAIESEMRLLASVRRDAVDPYFAYRLGVLGRLVARITAPLANDKSNYRAQYYQDVERNIRQIPLKLSQRKVVDPGAYFERACQLADVRKDLVLKDYQEGLGFNGIAKAQLSDDYSRSVDAVADVWYTILTGSAVQASVSEAQLSDYVVAAMAYYVARRNNAEIDASLRRLSALTPETPDLAKRIGDMFYDAGYYENAIAQYQIVLRAQPARKDVVERISAYYVKVGDEMLAEKRLQQAYDAYAKALEVNPLHPDAEGKRLKAESLISQRDARLDAARRSIEDAAKLETDAEQMIARERFAEAISALKEARLRYEEVTDEFPTEYQAASLGLSNVDAKLRDLKTNLIENAQSLSGTGFVFEVQKATAKGFKDFDEQALKTLNMNRLTAEMGRLRTKYQAVVESSE